jgi:hypothetical protein
MDRRIIVYGGDKLYHNEVEAKIQGHCLLGRYLLAFIQFFLLNRKEEETRK